jgi:hypothetical protein
MTPGHRVPGVHRTRTTLAIALCGAVALTACGTSRADQPGVPAGIAHAPAAGGDSALYFGGTGRDDVDRVKIPVDPPTAADIGATDTTIELWLKAGPDDDPAGAADCGARDAWIYGNIVLDRDRFGQGRKFGLSLAGGVVVFGLTGDGPTSDDAPAISMCGTTAVTDGRWHHVAVTRAVDSGEIVLYVDGQPEATAAGPTGDVSYPDGAVPESSCDGRPCTGSDPFLVLGAEKHDAGQDFPSYRGLLDEVRLSTVIRYRGPFTPPTRAFEVDADTAALYHFDEGAGTVAANATGDAASAGELKVGGSVPGPAWVASDAPTG